MRDLHNNIDLAVALNTAAISSDTTTVGNIIDLRGFNSAEFVIQSGTLTDGTYTPLLEEGDIANLSDAAAVVDADLLGTEALAVLLSTEDDAVKKLGYIGGKRYVRLSIVSTGTTSGGTVSALAVRGNPTDAPTA